MPLDPQINLLVVDDHSLFRRGLRALLLKESRFNVCGECADVQAALDFVAGQRPDVILLDNHMPGVNGAQAVGTLKRAARGSRILMLTVSENEEDLALAVQAGADGYLLKTVESNQLCEAIVRVMDGESVVSPQMMNKLFNAFRQQPMPSEPPSNAPQPNGLTVLSVREREILALIARGDSNKLIARALDIAETTVKIHVQHILRKLGLTSRVQAAVYAVHNGLPL